MDGAEPELRPPSSLARRVCAELAGALSAPVTAGASATIEALEEVPAARREAQRCLEALESLGRDGDGARQAQRAITGCIWRPVTDWA
jgi:Holliday junction resolvasome RuvABC DNA-binding subunit